ncbi:galactokinase [Salinimicrobium tongyeongense]|uniref:Galactokinase n=1 Tax=Salinimicrobium tongyeongense TaxID=2809707 RepID=A0ABY6NRZ8_9FLAO|nr:galactokinase [Salinimicrobium tongyeongense]UZH55436.1 galactokinase [Salinimicrobium tongyeongense]
MKNITEENVPETFRNFQKDFTVYAPGRINLIGEHTDYNNGFVLPTAIDKTIKLHFRANNTPYTCSVYSKTYHKSFSFDLRKISRSDVDWENYILGVVNEIQKLGEYPEGFDCIIESDLPVGAGISSSAALECGTAFGLNELFHLDLSRQAIAELSRNAEHNYVGTKCGIMDQYASILSKEGHLILLDCRNLEATYIPADLEGYKLLLLNTGVSHSLASSEYNTRRKECEEAVKLISVAYPEVKSLRDVNLERLYEVKDSLPEQLYRRAHYVVSENDRVLKAVEAIKQKDLEQFGLLMYDSHKGLRDEYQVSCKELDFLVELTTEYSPVKGARMMGGGFGGCTINLIEENALDEFIKIASEAYQKEFGITPEAIVVSPEQGTYLKKN